MSPSLIALTVYCAWTLLLVSGIAALRTYYTVTGRHRVNAFAPSGDDVSPFSGRLCRAHANAYENLGVVSGIILVAHLAGHAEVTDPLAAWLVGARIMQSSIHLTSTRGRAVVARFAAFVVQLGILGWWVVGLVGVGVVGR